MEGIVVKNPDSVWEPDSRKLQYWTKVGEDSFLFNALRRSLRALLPCVKVKPDYGQDAADLDLLIVGVLRTRLVLQRVARCLTPLLGGYFGSGHRSNLISSFMLAVPASYDTDGKPRM